MENRNKETFETWNKIAPIYEEKFMNMDLYNDSYDVICDALHQQDPKILEIGCGPGNIAKYLLSKRPDLDIFGIDIAPNMIKLAKLNNPSADFAVLDSRDIKNMDKKYDGIIGGFCLPYLSQTESNELIYHAYRLLNDKGLLYLSFVEGDPKSSRFIESSEGRVYFNFHELYNLKAQLIKTNFEDVHIFKVKYELSDFEFETHTILIARKKLI